jgi:hypothetical protein
MREGRKMIDLATFFREKKERLYEEEQRRKEVLEEWQRALEGLFDNIKRWLQPAEKEGLKVQPGSRVITEELLGEYEVPTLILRFGRQKVEIVPVGRFILGGAGRVDIDFAGGKTLLIRRTTDGPWLIVREKEEEELSETTFSALLQEIFS